VTHNIKVLHISDKLGVSGSRGDGVAQLLRWWFPLFREQGIAPELLVLGPSGEVVQEVRDDGIPVLSLNLRPLDPRAYFAFKRVVEKIEPDILHAHNWRATAFALWLRGSSDIPVVVHEHVINLRVPFVQRIADRILNHRVDRVLAVSEAAAKNCRETRHFPGDRIDVMINGIPLEPDSSYTAEQAAEVNQELGIEPESDVVGFVGRLDEQQGPRYLIEAFSILLSNHSRRASLVMIGDGPLEESLKELAGQLGIEECVHFLGYRHDVRHLRAAFTVQAMPSLWEGLPLAGLQAMAAGVPLVATDIDGPAEVLESDVNSILVPPGDSGALAQALSSILMDPERRERIARAARATVKHYDTSSNVRRMRELYAALSNSADSGSPGN